jgi:hypothetical protein
MNEVQKDNEEKLPIPITLKSSHACTERLYLYFRQHTSIFEFFMFAVQLAARADEVRFMSAEVLAKGNDPKYAELFEKTKNNKDAMIKRLSKFADIQSENMCIRLADNFICYLSEIIQSVLTKRPQMLSSKEQVSFEEIIRFPKRKELISYLIDKKLNELTHGGLARIEEYIFERTKIELAADISRRGKLAFAIELRNIYTHNRGKVNDVFLRRLSSHNHGFLVEKGKRFHADLDTIVELANNMASIARNFDRQIATKHGLRLKSFGTWHRQHIKNK